MDPKTVHYDPETRAVVGMFVGYLNQQEFQTIADALHELRLKHHGDRQMNNVVEMNVLSKETTDWLKNVWFPRAEATGLKYFAFVVPKSAVGKLAMRVANETADVKSPITIRYFATTEEARAWLKAA